MRCLLSSLTNCNSIPFSMLPHHRSNVSGISALHIRESSGTIHPLKLRFRFAYVSRAQSSVNPQTSQGGDDDDSQTLVEDLRVPDHWMESSKALEESEWLKVTLRKWLDDEYCPEETNVEISEVAALSFYNSLLDKQTDLGDILLKMALALESISFQESFHGAFSSANAAVSLIIQRIEHD